MSSPEDPPPRISKEQQERIFANNRRQKEAILNSGVDPMASYETSWVVKNTREPLSKEQSATLLARIIHRNRVQAGLSLLEALHIDDFAATPKPKSDEAKEIKYILELADTEIQKYKKMAENLVEDYRKALEENERMVTAIQEKKEEFLRCIKLERHD